MSECDTIDASVINAFIKQRNIELMNNHKNMVVCDHKREEEEEEEEEEDKWEVRAVVDHRGKHPNQEFLVDWKGLNPDTHQPYDKSWEPVSSFFTEPSELETYVVDPTHLPPAVIRYFALRSDNQNRHHTQKEKKSF